MFTERCHIKKNTKYLRTELNNLGYKCNNGKWMGSYLCTFHPIGASNKNEVCYCGSPEWDLKGNPDLSKSIDCGTDEDLFIAIAALRDDSDIMQYFTDGVLYIKSMKNIRDEYDLHKATVEELKKRFKEINKYRK
jgi:hypothetical protein